MINGKIIFELQIITLPQAQGALITEPVEAFPSEQNQTDGPLSVTKDKFNNPPK